MQIRNRNTFITIHTEGALLPIDLLQRVRENDASLEGLTPQGYHLAPGEKLNEAINRSWNRLNGLWGAFYTACKRLDKNETGATLTRERWLLPLFQELGFGRPSTARAVERNGKSYAISHRWENIPIHLIGCGLDLDKRTPGAAGASRTSPHSLLQEFLNNSEDAQWGLLSNGLRLRILRDNAAITRQAYLEFDLESMFAGEVYSDFVILWLVCHQSRFEVSEKQPDCALERWSKDAQERGTRALDDLRSGVETAIVHLGQGFLQHPGNTELRSRLKEGELSAQDYYRQILRLVYRLIFLFAAEDRDLLLLEEAPTEAKEIYHKYYSTARLRTLAERQRGSRHHDRYESLKTIMSQISGSTAADLGQPLALPVLGGFLFDPASTADLNKALLDNQALLAAVRSLAFITANGLRRAVDYRNLGSEELGSVYEALLERHPTLNTDAGTFKLSVAAGNERKTTGSYYTPTSLIKVLLDSALDPVIKERLQTAGQDFDKQEQALLALNVCDPACGSGHFLIAAAHRIAGKLAQVRAHGDEPSPKESRLALRDVIRHCIYGVDHNPMAVELCKVNLWLESLEPGKPLSFLDAHIKCGNSLVGVGPKMKLDELEIPDEAYNAVTGDHKSTAQRLKKRNKEERQGQETWFVTVLKTQEDLDNWLMKRTRLLEAMPEENAAQVKEKAEAYRTINESVEYRKQQQMADLWTAAFFWQSSKPDPKAVEVVAPTHGQLRRLQNGSQTQAGLLEKVEEISQVEKFFHWPLEFAEVDTLGGFDCVLGNPPWERIKLQEQEFFAARDPEIANAPNAAARRRLINQLANTNQALFQALTQAKHGAECASKFMRSSERFPLTAVGDVNTYALFAEHFRDLTNPNGRAGIIVPSGIATDDSTKLFFQSLVENYALYKLIEFENEGFFHGAGQGHMVRFCLLTLVGIKEHINDIEFMFQGKKITDLYNPERQFSLTSKELALYNPNTLTSPIFYTKIDAELTRKIYQRVPVLVNERTGENPWGVSFMRMFDMSNDSHLFSGLPKPGYVKLYEAKMFYQFTHRHGDYSLVENGKRKHVLPEVPVSLLSNPNYMVRPHYWISEEEINKRLPDIWSREWLISFRNVTDSRASIRTLVFSILPKVGVGNSAPLLLTSINSPSLAACFFANFCSIVLDYIARQKVSGLNLNFFIVKQLPVFPPEAYSTVNIKYIAKRVLELVYTAYDLQPFAKDMCFNGEPFKWDEDRRATLRAELDAYYAYLYGLDRDELRYILDPQDVYGPDFPGETFRVLKEKEIKLYEEYRTRRLVLEAWDRMVADGTITPGERPVIELPQPAPVPDVREVKEEKPIYAEKPTAPKAVKPKQENPDQLGFSGMGLTKCSVCGALVMSFDQGNHINEVHGGKAVEFVKVG